MRTKVLVCAALVAASAISAMAQVYSLNIVGYVNVTAQPNYNILANPLSASPNNNATNVLPVIDQMIVLTFNNGNYQYAFLDGTSWLGADGLATQPPNLAPGTGFWFFNPGATPVNLTFVGEVVPAPGVTNSLSVPANYSMLGSPMPVAGQAGSVANIDATGNLIGAVPPGGLNFPVLDSAIVLPYSGTSQSFGYYTFDTGNWLDAGGNTIPTGGPAIAPGQGFFYFNPLAGALQWKQALP